MVEDERPTAPASLPTYLAEGLPKQDTATLADVLAFVDALIEHKQRPVTRDDLPADTEPVAEDESDGGKGGTIVEELVTCGDETCHCADGEKHGPYKYRYYRDDSGTLTSEYLGKAE